ncbi:putative agmatinase 1 [Cladophialophora carrionii]|uniref:Putative agmatinase 1 n=1 Tax=Cladophialophora carrionii TaxID=86049 RepID=A0A1C1C7K2_9EURO|nr:putative agmatinase 1 [Cladophialophora carrionii]
MLLTVALAAACASCALAHGSHDQTPVSGPHRSLWYNTLPGDGGTQADSVFSGISTFGRLPYFPCLSSDDEKYDIAFIGAFLSSYCSRCPVSRTQELTRATTHTQARRLTPAHPTDQVLGSDPAGSDKVLDASISSTSPAHTLTWGSFRGNPGSRKLGFSGGYNVPMKSNPFNFWGKVIDCGDIPVTSYDNHYALQQIEDGHNALLTRQPYTSASEPGISKSGKTLPRIITRGLTGGGWRRRYQLGGDHTITLPLLRSINKAYGPISVIHFDSHLDTWKPKVFGGAPSKQAAINHGTYFYWASEEGLLANDSSIHAGIRTTLSGPSDYDNDGYCGFTRVEAREIDTIGIPGIIKRIRDRVGTTNPVYLSIDIDTLDPAFAPATGTPETGGWSTRELRTIIRGLEGINFVAADLVEVAPAYDTNAELTTMAAADVLYEVMTIMVKKGPLTKEVSHGEYVVGEDVARMLAEAEKMEL